MKISVEYSESIEVAPGLWRKIGIVINGDEYPGNTVNHADAQNLHGLAKEYVQKWHQEGGVGSGQLTGSIYGGSTQFAEAPKPHNSVIDRSIERLEIMIDDCKTKSDLDKIRSGYGIKIASTPSLSELFAKKMEEILQ